MTWVPVGDLSGGPFPATDAEIGELFNYVTAPFTVDGDQSCAHCHREDGNIAKAFSMPLTRALGRGLRMTMAYRGAADTRPWFFESSMDETNFKPVMNELARIENFCCSDYTLWPSGAPAGCATDPPETCATSGNPASMDGSTPTRDGDQMAYGHARPSAEATRDAFYLEAARRMTGRATTFGDAVFFQDPFTGEKAPLPITFDAITRALGVFLVTRTRLLPNPNPVETPAVLHGKTIFESGAAGCSFCHPAPTFAVSTTRNPLGAPLRFGPVVDPLRDADGVNLDLVAPGFIDAFPQTEQETCDALCGGQECPEAPCDTIRNVRLGVPSLRGIWDRAERMLHDGRAHGLVEVLCTPGHPALAPGQTGYNARDGIPDTHGGTSHLHPGDIADLVAYLLTL